MSPSLNLLLYKLGLGQAKGKWNPLISFEKLAKISTSLSETLSTVMLGAPSVMKVLKSYNDVVQKDRFKEQNSRGAPFMEEALIWETAASSRRAKEPAEAK